MKKLFCLAVLACCSFVGCGPTTPASNIKPAMDAPAATPPAATLPAESAPTETPKETAPPAEAPK